MNAMPSVSFRVRRHAAPALRRVAAVPEIEAECLVVVVLAVQVREPDVAHPREIGAERLIGEAGPDLGVFVRHVPAPEPEVEPGAVDVLVRVLREDHRLVVQSADRSRIDVPADAVVKANPDIEAPAVVSGRRGRSLRPGDGHEGDPQLLECALTGRRRQHDRDF